MAASMDGTVPKIDWLYPELLSKEGLVEILSQRFIKLPDNLEATSRDDLLELYYRYIIPLPQRKYRLNRRGIEMTKKQVLRAKKRRITGPDSSEPPAKKPAAESSCLLPSFGDIAIGNRLKPPPSCINFEKKTIKLGSSKATSDAVSKPNSAATIHNSTAAASTTPKEIKLKRSASSSSNPESPTISLKKTIKLINSHLSSSGQEAGEKLINKSEEDAKTDAKTGEQPMETDSTELKPVKKVKIKRIAWP